MTEPRRIELELADIETIEELAEAEEPKLRQMGEPYVQLKKIAELQMQAKPKRAAKKAAPKVEEVADEPADDSADGS
jgi:predicted RecB family nuclease